LLVSLIRDIFLTKLSFGGTNKRLIPSDRVSGELFFSVEALKRLSEINGEPFRPCPALSMPASGLWK
jgi:hypothetical protein